MSTAPSVAINSPGTPRLAAMASRPLAIALVVVALVTAVRLTGTVDSDVAWQLWIAGRIHAGAHLYRDIIEVNPPLWFWMALPVDSVATLVHLRPETILVASIGGIVALALAATDRLLPSLAPRKRAMLLSYAALALIGIPWVHIGQREQLVLIATVPYAALITARRERMSVSPLLALLIGCSAALGFSLKHYFLLIPAALELWLLASLGREWRWRRPEPFALIATGVLYAGAVLLYASDFLTVVIPLVRLTYGELGAPSLRYLFGPFASLGLMCLFIVTVEARVLPRRTLPLTSALLVAAGAFGAIYFIQAKGWIYHAIPLLGCASLALAALLVESDAPMRRLRLAAPALLVLPLVLAAEEWLHPLLPSPDLQNAVSGMRPGDTVGYLAVETAIPWSITLQKRLRYPSRYMGYWMLNAVVSNERRGSPDRRLTALGKQVVAETVEDFACMPPKLIIVSRPRAGEDGFDILPFFLRDQQFAALLSHYRVRSRTSLETYELVSPIPAASSGCRRGV